MSSPANQAPDPDIDLDFGDGEYDGGVQLQDDEHMLTDGEQTRPATATDDMMDDDVQVPQQVVEEADMEDTPDVEPQTVQQDDEELIDYEDEEYFDQQQTEDTTLVNVPEDAGEQSAVVVEDADHVDEEIARQPQNVGFEEPAVLEEAVVESTDFTSQKPSTEEAHFAANGELSHATHDEFNESAEQYDAQPEGDADQPAAEAPESADPAVPFTAYVNDEATTLTEPPVTDVTSTEPALTVDTSAYVTNDTPSTPTDTGLHPVTVYYGELACPLFKSKTQPDGLLKDDNLASLSLHELMLNCRQRLALKIGNVPEEQEFTLAFDHMGLMLVEVSSSIHPYQARHC